MADSDLIHDLVLGLGVTGLFITVPVEPGTGPFLVTGTKDLLWVDESSEGLIRSGVRSGSPPANLYADVVREVASFGTQHEWGNTFPHSSVGLMDAEDYLFSYGILELDFLIRKGDPAISFQASAATRVVETDWVQDGCSVLVPRCRGYLGFVGLLKNSYTAVLHNPSRGMVVLGTW